MVKNIVKGKHIFARKAKPATEADKQVVTDLIDTLRANREICVGMAANMIGVNKSIIVVAFWLPNIFRSRLKTAMDTERALRGYRTC